MKVTGFTFIRNAIRYDYPVTEAIRSILPVCDNFVVAVGRSEDDTLEIIRNIDPKKIKIVETEWDDSLREGGRVLALETDKAFRAVEADTDWCFYIQGDEIMHEQYLDTVYEGMKRWKDHKDVDGLLFHYLHFYGSYDYVGNSSRWYDYEIRIIKNNKNIFSYRDAQGFRIGNNEKLRVKLLDAWMYHYGWVKPPAIMQKKVEQFNKLWHDDEWMEKNIVKADEFDFRNNIDSLQKFTGTHPSVMQQRIRERNWQFDYDISYNNKLPVKTRLKKMARDLLGLDFSYRNYKLV